MGNFKKSGADKVAVNTAAIKNPQLINDIANAFGSQAVVLSIEAKQIQNSLWEPYYIQVEKEVILELKEWIKQGISLGAGELLLTSADREEQEKGFDTDLLKEIKDLVDIPLIFGGGMGKIEDVCDALDLIQVDGFAIADILHFNRSTISEIKANLKFHKVNVRQ